MPGFQSPLVILASIGIGAFLYPSSKALGITSLAIGGMLALVGGGGRGVKAKKEGGAGAPLKELPEGYQSYPIPGEKQAKVRYCKRVGADISLAYHTIGDPSGKPLLMLPGVQASLLYFADDWCRKLADELGLYIIRMEHRSSGLSEPLLNLERYSSNSVIKAKLLGFIGVKTSEDGLPFTLKDMAEDAVALLDHLGIERAHILGNSMGGMVAQEIAMGWPDRVSSLILVMTSPGGRWGCKESSVAFQLKHLTPMPEGHENRVRHLVEAVKRGSGVHFDEEWVEDYWRRVLKRAPFLPQPHHVAICVVCNSGRGRQPRLHSVKKPCTIIHGKLDPVLHFSHAKRLSELIEGSNLVLLEDIGHDWMPKSRLIYQDLVRDHFEGMN